jgi:hypothetical protein
MDKIVKDLKVILSSDSKSEFGKLITELSQRETEMAHLAELIPLDFFLDYGHLVSSFYEMYLESVQTNKGFSYEVFIKKLEILEQTSSILRNKENKLLSGIGTHLKAIYLRFSDISLMLTIGMLK